MLVSQGDYVVVSLGKKPELAKITAVPEGKKGTYKAVLCKDEDTEKQSVLSIDISKNEIKSNLGRTPKVGSVYGARVEPLLKTRESKFWNEIRFYTHLGDEWEKTVIKEIASAMRRLQELKLDGVILDLEIREVSGKYAGWYKWFPKRDIDKLCVKPQPNAEGLRSVVWHEYGHAVWFRRMTSKQRFKWVKLYHQHIGLQEVGIADLDDIRGEVESSGSIGQFLRDVTEDNLVIFKAIMRQISQVHNMQKKHLDMALHQGESLEDFWPTSLELSDKVVLITDYARKSPEELFAEAFQIHMEGKKLPKIVRGLMEETLTKLTRPQGAQVATKRERPEKEDSPKKKKKSSRNSNLK